MYICLLCLPYHIQKCFVIICCSQWLFMVWSLTHFNLKKGRNYDHSMLYSDCVSSILNVNFLTIVPCSTFEWQIKPARITFSSPNKIRLSLLQVSHGKQDIWISTHSFNIRKWELFCMIILIAKLDEQFWNVKSSNQREQTIEENVGKKWMVQRRPTSCC